MHIPGPWKVREFENASPQIATESDAQGFGKPIATVEFLGHEIRKANARLIAAAPDLLEACQRALISLGHVLDDYADIPETPEETEKTLDFVKMAIRKAKGIK